MWMREVAGERLSEVRVKQLLKDDPGMIVTSCPYCLVMFDDAVRTLGVENVKCYDLLEVIRDII